MATVQQFAPPAKHEAFVEQQLRRARFRIRAFDIVAALLGFCIGTLGYGLGMVFLDRWLDLPSLVRQLAFAGYLIVAAVYLLFFVARPLFRRINLHYAARLVERTVPGAKNSLVNWLDVRDQRLPAAIRGAVGMRAAKDLSRVDLESAISGRRVLGLGGVAVLLFLTAVAVLAIFRPGQFFSLLDRAFAPFGETTIATRTHLILLQPANGDAVVPVNQPVAFVARVEGRVPDPNQPDALKLLFRTNQADPVYQERLLERGDADREWALRLPAFELHNGFWYKIAGGDAETPEYRIDVRSSPLVTRCEVVYHYRPYLCRTDRASDDPNLEAPRGTEVLLIAHTNRRVQQGSLRIDGEAAPATSAPVPNSPDAMAFQLVMQKNGTYRIQFTSIEEERSGDSVPYTIKAIPDLPPQVILTQPGKDVTLPADGVLSLEGSASDDHGVTGLTLRLRVKDGVDLQPKAYRREDNKSFRFEDGSYPRKIDYSDFIELDKLRDANGAKPALNPGTAIEYWLEAADNCDYPAANVARTKETFKITIGKPLADPKKNEQARKQAEQKKQEQQKKQEKQLDQENQKKKEQQEANNRNQNGDPNRHEKSKDPKQQEKDKNLNEQARRLNDEINKKKDKGDAKPDRHKQPKGEGKGEGQQSQPQPKGEGKNPPKDGNPGAGANKPEGQSGQGQPTPQSEKGQTKPEPKGRTGKEPNQGSPGKDEGKGQSRNKPEPGKGQAPGGNKDKGDKGGGQAGKEKGPGGNGQPNQEAASGKKEGQGNSAKGIKGEPKGKGQAGHTTANQQDTGAAKGDADAEARGDVKHKSQGNPSAPTAQGTPKSDAPFQPGQEPPGGGKPASTEQAKGSGGAKGEGPHAPAKEPGRDDVARAANNLKNGDAQKREEAARQLRDMSRNAKDPQVRKDAEKALNENGPRVGSEPKGNEKNRTNDPGQTASAKGKPTEGQPGGSTKTSGKGKPNDRGRPKGADPKATADNPPPGGEAKGAEGNPKAGGAKEKGPGQPGGKTPGIGDANTGPGGAPEPGDRPELLDPEELEPAKTTTADLRHKLHAGELLLEKFKERVTPEMLKQLNMTKEQYQQFLNDYNRRLKEGWARLHEREKLDRPLTGNAPRSNPGIVRNRPGKQKTTDPLQSGGPLLAPAEFRRQYREFTEELSKLRPRSK